MAICSEKLNTNNSDTNRLWCIDIYPITAANGHPIIALAAVDIIAN